MNGQELIERVRDVYAKLDSYSDVGTVESPGHPGPGLEFQTYFKKPLNFRFHWLSWHPHFGRSKPANETTLWSDGQIHGSSYFGKIEYAESLKRLVAGAAGVSHRSVHQIMNILVPGVIKSSHNWHEMTAVEFLGDEEVNGAECFHVIGTIRCSEDCEVWLEKATCLVRRLREKVVITEEESAKMRAELGGEPFLWQLCSMLREDGLSDEMIEKISASLKSDDFRPTTYEHIYDYTKVAVNQQIDDALFSR